MGVSVSTAERRIILLGKTGDGKSSAGNTILGKKVFTPKASSNSVTGASVRGDGKVNGKKITVIDTPGIFDTCLHEEAIKSEIIKSLIECAPGPDAIIFVLKVDRFTTQETEIVDRIFEYIGENAFNHVVFLFTHGEQLEGQTIEEYVRENARLQELINNCGGRCHVIDSKYWKKCFHCPCSGKYSSNKVQVKGLLHAIENIVQNNESYTNELYQIMEEEIQNEMNNINEDNLLSEERRERAKRTVHEKLLIKLAGMTTGVLVGATLGVGACVALTVALIKSASRSEVGVAGIPRAIAAGSVVGTNTAGVVLSASALIGAASGGFAGWESAEEADSVTEAINRATKVNYENAKYVVEKGQEFVYYIFNPSFS